jgi:hypothetical protein
MQKTPYIMYQLQYIITGIFNHKIVQKSALPATSKLETSQNRISAPMLMEGFPTLPPGFGRGNVVWQIST